MNILIRICKFQLIHLEILQLSPRSNVNVMDSKSETKGTGFDIKFVEKSTADSMGKNGETENEVRKINEEFKIEDNTEKKPELGMGTTGYGSYWLLSKSK